MHSNKPSASTTQKIQLMSNFTKKGQSNQLYLRGLVLQLVGDVISICSASQQLILSLVQMVLPRQVLKYLVHTILQILEH